MTASDRLGRLLIGVLLVTGLWTLWGSGWPPQRTVSVRTPSAVSLVEEEPYLLPPVPNDTAALASALFSYIELPQRWCRRLAMLGGHIHKSSSGAAGIDGNKFICLDAPPTRRPPCLVYSFGSNNEWSFESDVIRQLGCEVHTFDPSLSGGVAPRDTHGAAFHPLGLGGRAQVTSRGWRLAPLRYLRQQLGHQDRPISYLKVDIEGGEWEWLEAEAGALQDVLQIGMEVHLMPLNPAKLKRVYSVFRRLQAAGFRTVFSEVNLIFGRSRKVVGVDDKVGAFYELVWVRTR